MCFFISERFRKKQLKEKVAYKVVVMEDTGTLTSVCATPPKTWRPGVHRRSKGRTFYHTSFREGLYNKTQSSNGIYVFTSLRHAKVYCIQSCYVILKVHVEPKDLLHVSMSGSMATYEKVTVPEKQPHIEW